MKKIALLFLLCLAAIFVNAQSGIITTIAGTGGSGYTGDGRAATAASIDAGSSIATDAAGNLYLTVQAHNFI